MSSAARAVQAPAQEEEIAWVEPADAALALVGLGGLAWLDAARAEGAGTQTSWLAAGPCAELAEDATATCPARLEAFVRAAPALAVGYLGYDLGRAIERVPVIARPDVGVRDVCVRAYASALRLDHRSGRAWLLGEPRARTSLARALGRSGARAPGALGPLEAEMDGPAHAERVRQVLEYIHAGDVYQANLARRFRGALRGDALSVYLALRAVSPAPMGAYLEGEDWAILSNSPERLVRVRGRRIEAEPIKGTRPRGRTPEEDVRLAAELARDEKEQAEHVMIVDLLRNDLGRISEIGSVGVDGMARLLSVANVHHLVSTVRGTLRADVGLEAIVRATFPGGSITGAPKVRAMEIIEELEPVRRGPYTGAIGWATPGGELDWSIAIRTGVLRGAPRRGGDLLVWVGGGIVADSTPAGELAETEVKLAAWRRVTEAAWR